MKARLSNLGDPPGSPTEYDCKYEWDCPCQAGNSGVVVSKNGNYKTAFFEAFPQDPSCWIRGEGDTVEEAEEKCWEKYKQVKSCNHEMDRRGRTDGYAYCKNCPYAATVFEPLTKCCKCAVPTAYSKDHRDKWYCEKHDRTKPKNPDPKVREWYTPKKKYPRKYKKLLKKCAKKIFNHNGYFGKVQMQGRICKDLVCENMVITLFGKHEERNVIDRAMGTKSTYYPPRIFIRRRYGKSPY